MFWSFLNALCGAWLLCGCWFWRYLPTLFHSAGELTSHDKRGVQSDLWAVKISATLTHIYLWLSWAAGSFSCQKSFITLCSLPRWPSPLVRRQLAALCVHRKHAAMKPTLQLQFPAPDAHTLQVVVISWWKTKAVDELSETVWVLYLCQNMSRKKRKTLNNPKWRKQMNVISCLSQIYPHLVLNLTLVCPINPFIADCVLDL